MVNGTFIYSKAKTIVNWIQSFIPDTNTLSILHEPKSFMLIKKLIKVDGTQSFMCTKALITVDGT